MKNIKTHVIIGRFQINYPHNGHIYLINKVVKRTVNTDDNFVIVVGNSPIVLSDRNPLNIDQRVNMIKAYLYNNKIKGDVLSINDNISDHAWSNNLDNLLKDYPNVILYGGRDSFIPHYRGTNKTIEIESIDEDSSTLIRREIGKEPYFGMEFLRGIIYATQNKFPTVYPTVDIAIFREVRERKNEQDWIKLEILLGRKKNDRNWYFPGGFVDPKDNSLLDAAARELKEEVPGLEHHELKFVTSLKMHDWRYRGTKDGIMTSLFMTYSMGGDPKAGDDLDEIHWFPWKKPTRSIIGDCHKPLFDKLYSNGYNK